MKNNSIAKWLAGAALACVLVACNETNETGLHVQPEGDKIGVFLDTFVVTTSDYYQNAISAQCDTSTMALGEFYSESYGSTKAELLVQLAPPLGYRFPPDSLNPVADSLVLYMYYDTWFGSEKDPLEISVYEINKKAIHRDSVYHSNLDVAQFTDQSQLMGKRVVTAVDQTLPDSVLDSDSYYPVVRYKFSDEQLQRFYGLARQEYTSYDDFLETFKGLYITTKYGASTIFYFNRIDLRLFYHYSVQRDGRDTILSTSIIFPSNQEVRQLNHFEHTKLPAASAEHDTVDVVKSPAGIYQHVEIPVKAMHERLAANVADKKFNVSSAMLVVEALEASDEAYPMQRPYAMMLIRQSHLDRFISENYVPQTYDSIAAIALYESNYKAYRFDLAYLVTYDYRQFSESTSETETFVLVPCSVVTSSAGDVEYVRPLRRLGGVRVRSGAHKESPMRIRLVYNAF